MQRYAGKKDGKPVLRTFGPRRPTTINRSKAMLSAVLTWAQRRRMTPRGWRNPSREIPGLHENNARVSFLSNKERKRLLLLARVSRCRKLYLLILTALVTGARRGELMALRFRDLDLDNGRATVERSKNGERRVLVLTPALIAEIKRMGVGAPDALLFGRATRPLLPFTFETAWQRLLTDARIEDFRFHDLRHSCASLLAQNGATLLEIADVLGHKQLDVTRRYSHLCVDHKSKLVQRVLGGIGARGHGVEVNAVGFDGHLRDQVEAALDAGDHLQCKAIGLSDYPSGDRKEPAIAFLQPIFPLLGAATADTTDLQRAARRVAERRARVRMAISQIAATVRDGLLRGSSVSGGRPH